MKINYDEAKSEIIPVGEYEVTIQEARMTYTRSGTPCIDIPLIIREDIDENPVSSGRIFHTLWKRKEPTIADQACDGFSSKQVQMLSKAAGLPNGKAYDNMQEWCDDLKGRFLRVTVEHEEYNGQTRARVKWTNESKRPNGFTPVDDESDVPF